MHVAWNYMYYERVIRVKKKKKKKKRNARNWKTERYIVADYFAVVRSEEVTGNVQVATNDVGQFLEGRKILTPALFSSGHGQ